MSEHLPVVSGRELIRVFERLGWEVKRQTGSHIVMYKTGASMSLSIPNHKAIAKGTLHSILKDADLRVEEFRGLL
jgi:predicted RNA binding protein YcfA (HicA-like mRNA interferase family)